ncbi:MAG: Hsp20/alpha crystallin family protein [Planctomycetota bacterium]|nr:MAG: Hsp20/alpha crystallin family protein [Planctomycetota bacterium]
MANLIPFTSRTPGLFADIDREFDNLLSRFWGSADRALEEWTGANVPRLNVAETENAYEVTVDLPGLNPDDINVEFSNGELRITGERKQEKEEKGKTYHRVESYYGKFQRTLYLGEGIDADKIEAEYKDGVLRLTLPKSQEAATKRIAVKS